MKKLSIRNYLFLAILGTVLSCASGEKKDGAEVKELAVSAKEVVITNSVIEITHDS